jgi:hypothetical protein
LFIGAVRSDSRDVLLWSIDVKLRFTPVSTMWPVST